jgi:hypothetical protein
VSEEVMDNAAQGFARAEVRVSIGELADLFAFDGILLVREGKGCTGDGSFELVIREWGTCLVIQRCVRGRADAAMDGESDVTEAEGLAAGFCRVWGEEVFGRAEEPEEGHSDKVDGVELEGPQGWVVEVQCPGEATEDGDVGRVGSGGWVVGSFHAAEESMEYGMEFVSA